MDDLHFLQNNFSSANKKLEKKAKKEVYIFCTTNNCSLSYKKIDFIPLHKMEKLLKYALLNQTKSINFIFYHQGEELSKDMRHCVEYINSLENTHVILYGKKLRARSVKLKIERIDDFHFNNIVNSSFAHCEVIDLNCYSQLTFISDDLYKQIEKLTKIQEYYDSIHLLIDGLKKEKFQEYFFEIIQDMEMKISYHYQLSDILKYKCENSIIIPIIFNQAQIEEIKKLKHLAPFLSLNKKSLGLKDTLSNMEAKIICESLNKTNGNKKMAASLLGLNRTTLIEKMKRLSIQ